MTKGKKLSKTELKKMLSSTGGAQAANAAYCWSAGYAAPNQIKGAPVKGGAPVAAPVAAPGTKPRSY